jgi:uncharacterized protein YbaA (DUF1428 family)
MERTIESTTIETIKENGRYVQFHIYRVPKKNHDAMVQLNKQVIPWFEKQGARMEFFKLSNSETIEGVESIAKTLSIAEDEEEEEEELWLELNYFRDRKHINDVFPKMTQDESVAPLFKQFERLITLGKSMTTGGFSPLRIG